MDALMNKKQLDCPECDGKIEEFEQRSVLYPSELGKIAQKEQDEMLETLGIKLIECDKCKNKMEVESGQVDYNSKNDKGQVMTPEQCEDLAKNRIRCYFCEEIFCHSCGERPYHLGQTCQELKAQREGKKCRFCKDLIQGASDVCDQDECQELSKISCNKTHACGHSCCGYKDEEECLPCLNPECAQKEGVLNEGVDEDAYCTICWVSELGAEPCIRLGCGHVFHARCVKQIVDKKWTSLRINFGFLDCPSCKQPMELEGCSLISDSLAEAKKLRDEITKLSIERA